MNPGQRRVLADLLIQWEDLYRQGQDTPASFLCKDHPELAETLTRQIAALKRVAWLDKKLEDDGDDPGDARPDDPRPSRLLARRYRLDQLIATGGFAEVWRAFDQELLRIIAVKIPKRTVIGSSESFLAEARRVARLKHPGIVPIHDVGLEDGECFFVTEYVEGGSLADRLTRGNLSADQACQWIASIADAVDHAHRSGVIHRDVKPANILIDAHGRALLADFGIAQSSMKTGDFAPSLGTLRYMAPEQLDGQEALPQSDIYSLAVVLHEVLTGTPPYSSVEPNTIRREIGSGAKLSKDVPSRLVPALRKALNKDPGQRFGSAAEFAAVLRNASRPTSRIKPLGAFAAAGILFGLWSWHYRPTPQAGTPHRSAASPSSSQSPIRREMPYPMPPSNRREWRSQPPDPGLVYRFDETTGWWLHYREPGPVEFRFQQTRVTDDGIDLEDPSRKMWITLTGTACNSRASPTYPHDVVLAPGSWANESASPYPREFDKRITLASERDSLEGYIKNVSNLTGVIIEFNVPALAREGITRNQTFAFDMKNTPASDVLMALLHEADPEDRLTAVLRATDDGQTAIDVTTKQALEKRD